MSSKLLLLCFWLTSFAHIYGQKATVTFTTDKDCEVFVYAPIDGGYNEKIPTTRLIASPAAPADFRMELSSYLFLCCRFPQYQSSCNVILFPNDSINVHVSDDDIIFRGSNHAGQQYLYENFMKHPDLDNYMKIQNVFTEYLDNKRELYSIIPAVDERRGISAHLKAIEELPLLTNTSPAFTKVLKDEVWMELNSDVLGFLQYLLSGQAKGRQITAKDSVEINRKQDSIFSLRPIDLEIIKHPARILYISRYLSRYYAGKECPDGYDAATFGPYVKYLFMPAEMQPVLFGGAFLVQQKYDTGEMKLPELKAFFNKNFPDSEYAAIINKQLEEEKALTDDSPADRHFISRRIDALPQLNEVEELKGKYLYLDLWASWCMPCRGEFSHKSEVEELINTYKDVVIVYISLDQANQEKAWRNCIARYKLDGFHLRASSELEQDIMKQIYGADVYEIPRYVLISPTGKILHKDLPRPSRHPQLKEALDRILRTNN